MSAIRRAARRFDEFQQRHAALAFPLSVWTKLNDDQAGNFAALLAFYAFVSLFPLLLVLTTVLGVLSRRYPGVQERVLDSALVDFPIIGQQLKTNLHAFGRSGLALAVGIVATLLGSRGLANAAQTACNRLWAVPYTRRPGFPFSWLRSYGMIAVIGLGAVATSVVSGVGAWKGGGVGMRVLLLGAAFAVNAGLFWLGLRLATAKEVAGRDLRIGAVLGAAVWQVLQWFGEFVVAHQLRHASSLYGVFGLVLGLVAWLYLQARLILYAVQIDVVRARGLWPRSLFPPPLTSEDKRAYRSYQRSERRSPDQTSE